MKKLIPLIFLGLIATLLPSCCGLGGCARLSRIEAVGCENQCYTTQEVTKYRMVDPGNGEAPYKVAYTETVKTEAPCGACGSSYCPTPRCCDIISLAVLKRATAQGGSGEPHIGTIPTMKVLAE